MKLIETKTVTTAGPSLVFSDVPQTFTDLALLMSTRGTGGVTTQLSVTLSFNGTGGTGSSNRYLIGNGSSLLTGTLGNEIVWSNPASSTAANTFSNSSVYIANYTSATVKSISADAAFENDTTTAGLGLTAMLWNNTAAITSIELASSGGINFAVGTTFSLYGIGGAGDGYAPKATGGSISFANGYWVHTFTASGTFTPTASLSNVEYVVIGGGGGGGGAEGGAGGAGGYRSSVVGESSGGGGSAESRLSLASGTNYTVTIGAGGISRTQVNSDTGISSTFASITSAGGGGGAYNAVGLTGGSGGGSSYQSTGGSGTANQGFAGGGGFIGGNWYGGGGGGASAAGQAGQSSKGGNGGNGVASSITGSSVTRAGGGGAGTNGVGGSGGGGNGSTGPSTGQSGTANTGGGGGGGFYNGAFFAGGAGGSGVVIVRYAA